MSKNWGRTPVTNADKRALTQSTYLVPSEQGGFEERIDRRPMGKCERWVDKEGNVATLPMFADGDPKPADTYQRNQAAYRKKGFVEHAKCPLRHGAHNRLEVEKEFRKLPANLRDQCDAEPRVMERRDGDLYAKTGCAHIEWLIEHRRKNAADAYAKRNAHVAAAAKAAEEKKELEALQAALLKEQLAERKARKSPKGTNE